jgi:hypothetical protein
MILKVARLLDLPGCLTINDRYVSWSCDYLERWWSTSQGITQSLTKSHRSHHKVQSYSTGSYLGA